MTTKYRITEVAEWNEILNVLLDPEVSEIASNGPRSFFFVKNGKRIKLDIGFSSEKKYFESVKLGLLPHLKTTRVYDESGYLFEARLNYSVGGTEVIARCHIGLPPATTTPQITIAKKSASLRSLEAIASTGAMSTEMMYFLETCVDAGLTTVLSGGTGAGKNLEYNTKIATPFGIKKAGDLNIGDVVFDENGKETTITNKYSPNDPKHYRLTFKDGTTVDAGMGHLWKVTVLNEKVRFGHASKPILTDEQIVNIEASLKTDPEKFITFKELKTILGGKVSATVRPTVEGLSTLGKDFFNFETQSVVAKIKETTINPESKKEILERFEKVEEKEISLGRIKELIDNRYFVSRVFPEQHAISDEMILVKNEALTHLLKDHEQRLEARRNIDASYKSATRPVRLMTTQEMVEYGVRNKTDRLNFAVEAVSGPVQYREQELPIEPYTLGAWLGDGRSSNGEICGIDHEVPINIVANGMVLEKESELKRESYKTLFNWTFEGLRSSLRMNGLLGNKHIPEIYKYSSMQQRIDLLSGLVDTDGTVDYRRGTVILELTIESIIRDAREIAASLGWSPTPVTSRERSYKDENGVKVKCKDTYRFAFYPDRQIFNVVHKAELLQERMDKDLKQQSRMRRHYITNIELIPDAKPEEYFCFEVDSPTHMFLCSESFIPTHNTTMLEAMAKLFPEDYRIAVAEDIPELVLTQENVTYWEAVPYTPGMNPNDVATLQWVVKQFQRNRNDRIIIGETRGAEFSEFLIAANSGKNGSLTTIHADNPESCLRKMTNFALQGFGSLSARAVNTELSTAVDIIVQLNRFPDTGRHRVTHIQEVTETLGVGDDSRITTQPLYVYDEVTDTFKKTENMTDSLRKLLTQRGVDPSKFLLSKINTPVRGHMQVGSAGMASERSAGNRSIGDSPINSQAPTGQPRASGGGGRLPTGNPFKRGRTI